MSKDSYSQSITNKLRFLGFIILSIYLIVILFTPFLSSIGLIPDPSIGLDNEVFSPPSFHHFFGTDRLGRDVFSRTLNGAGVALQVVMSATLLAVFVGLPLGLISGYYGGIFDRVFSLIMDTLYTIPVLLLSIVLAFLLGKGILNASIAICVVYAPQYFRLVRNQTIKVKSNTYVEAAKSMGAGPIRILSKYIFRNVVTPIPILLTLNAADAVLVLGSLGFLGLGLPANIPEWGSDLNLALSALPTGIWWTALFPGLAMVFLVLGLSFIGEDLDSFINGSQQNQ